MLEKSCEELLSDMSLSPCNDDFICFTWL